MADNRIVPCLWLDDQAERAAAFYTSTFRDGRVVAVAKYPESVDNPAHKPRGSVLTVDFEIEGQRFTALNGGPLFHINPSISFFALVESPAEADALFSALERGGKVMMPLAAYPWSARYAWVQDQFGVSWQIMTRPVAGPGPRIVPCLMFAGKVHGRAAEAIEAYVAAFPSSQVDRIERYAPGEGPVGFVKHGRFLLSGQPMIAMDSHVEHDVNFDEGLSLQVMCEDQADVDRMWERLSDGGKPGPCGWLTDRFGLSWQIVPKQIAAWMASGDEAARERAFAAVMKMGKLDLAAIDRAYRGV